MFYSSIVCETKKKDKEKTKIGKDVLDYTESDIYRLADQWDVSQQSIDYHNFQIKSSSFCFDIHVY
jgi:hypothetical protein